MMKAFLYSLFFVTLPMAAMAAPASLKPAIAAVVGEQAISSYDVENRLAFVIATTKLSDNPDTVARIRPQIIRALIDEKLQLMEAVKYNFTVTDDDVDKAIVDIEKTRNMQPGAIFRMMQERRIPKSTFTDQIRAQLAWRKLVIKKIRPLIRISNEAVELALKSVSAAPAAQELKISIITLPVDKQAREQEVVRTMEKLTKELRDGASFEEVSRQFSGQLGEIGKTDAFWIRAEQLDPVMGRALVSAKTGTITEPIRTEAGFAIVKVYDVRTKAAETSPETELMLKEIVLTLSPDASNKEANILVDISEEVAKHPGTCEDKSVAGLSDTSGVDIHVTLEPVLLSQLPPAIRTIVEPLKAGEISAPFASPEGIRLYMLCNKKDATEAANFERVRNQLFNQQIELEAQKTMRNLRRDTFIEIR